MESSLQTLKCLALGKLSNTKRNISIIKIGDFENQILDRFIELLDSYLSDKEIKILQTKTTYVPLSRLKRHCIGDHKKLGTVPK